MISILTAKIKEAERIRSHVFVCVLSLPLSGLIERNLGNEMTISAISAILSGMKAVPVKFPSGTGMFRAESIEADAVLKRLGIPVPKRTLTGTLPKME